MQMVLFILTFICPPFLKPALLRLCGARVGKHVQIGWFAAVTGRQIEIGDYSEIRALTLVQCDGTLRIGAYSIISSFTLIYGCAGLIIGDHAYIGPQSLINCDEDVRLGNHSALGARSMVYTHGSYLPYTEGYWVKFGAVTIGDYVWCAAGVFIHPGITIGNNVFVNSRSVVTQDVGDGEVMEGFPAKRVATMNRLKRTMTPRRIDAAATQMVQHFGEMVLRRQLQLEVEEIAPGLLYVTYNSKEYAIGCIPSTGDIPEALLSIGRTLVLLINRPGWNAPAGLQAPFAFDLGTMLTKYRSDPIHHQLDLFMRRYYGVQFVYEEQ